MSNFDALVDELDRFQKWKGRKARKPAITPRARPAAAVTPERPMQAQLFSKAMDSLIAEAEALRRQTARLRAQQALAERQRGYAKLNEIMAKADALAGEGRLTASEIGILELRCNAMAARLQKQGRAGKAAGGSR